MILPYKVYCFNLLYLLILIYKLTNKECVFV